MIISIDNTGTPVLTDNTVIAQILEQG